MTYITGDEERSYNTLTETYRKNNSCNINENALDDQK